VLEIDRAGPAHADASSAALRAMCRSDVGHTRGRCSSSNPVVSGAGVQMLPFFQEQ